MSYEIFCDDNRNVYRKITQDVVVITDPPYGAEVHSKDKVGRNANREVDTAMVPFEGLTKENVQYLSLFCNQRVKGWALIFCQTEQINEWRAQMEYESAVRYFRPMVWIKPNAKPNLRGHGPGIGHETIQAYWCGEEKQRWNGGGKVGVFYHNTASAEPNSFRHPTGKPVSLMKELVRYFTNPGDTIFDPFMGCGSTGVAAIELGRNFIGVEKNRQYYEEAERRLKEAAEPGLMFAQQEKLPTLFGDSAFGSVGTRKRLEREAREKNDAD